MSASNRSHAGPRENGVIFANGSLFGTSSYSVSTDTANVPRQQLIDFVDHASEILPLDWVVQINPGGGTDVSQSMSKHPNGWAVDLQLIDSTGTLHTPDSAPTQYSTFISALVGNALLDKKHIGIGMYSWGIHFDISPARQTGIGDITVWNENDISNQGINSGRQRADDGVRSLASNVYADGTSDSKTDFRAYTSNNDNELELLNSIRRINEPGPASFASQNINGATFSSLASLRAGEGFAINADLVSAINDYQTSTYPNKWKSILEKLDTGNFSPSWTPNGTIPGTLTALSATEIEDVEDLHLDSDHYFLTGKILEFTRTNISHISSTDKILSDVINNVARDILGAGSVSKFTKIFLDTISATQNSASFGLSLQQLEGQVFGNTKSTQENPFSTTPGMTYKSLAGSKIVDLIGDAEEKLKEINNSGHMFNTFGSLYKDFNGLTTLGFGSLSTNLPLLGSDLIKLGKLINFEDLMRIGKPSQILERILFSDCSVVGILLPIINTFNINLANVNKKENDSTALRILSDIQQQNHIAEVFKCFNVNRTLPQNLAEICNPQWQFAQSYNYNNFDNIGEISVHLLTMGVNGIKNSAELGEILTNLESVNEDNALQNQSGTITAAELLDLREAFSPLSDYSGDNGLTVGDFLGTAAGYRHNKLLPIIANEIERIKNTANGATYDNLLDDLLIMLNGGYIVEEEPSPGVYTYKITYSATDYASLAAAVGALTSAMTTAFADVESELTSPQLNRYQSYQTEMLHQLYKENHLRTQYGITIGSSVTATSNNVLDFALNLEDAALLTGHGRQADFLNRVSTQDYHGGRIRSTMIQKRNKKFLDQKKITLKNQNTVLNDFTLENINNISDFVKTTGIWTTEPDRSSEIYLQLNQKVKNRYEYTLRQVRQNQTQLQNVVDTTCVNILRQLMFVSENNIALTEKFTGLYYEFSEYYNNMHLPNQIQELKMNLNNAYTTNGYILGPVEEIIGEFGKIEKIENNYIGYALSEENSKYINSLGLDLKKVVGLMQKILLINAAGYLGIQPVDYHDIFRTPSVIKYLLTIITLDI